jgi:hypothetical protein
MPKLFEIESEQGTIYIEAPGSADEIEAIGRGREVVERVNRSIGDVLGMVSSVAHGFADSLADAPVESAELEFSLQFTAKGSIYIAEAESQGAIRVMLKVVPNGGTRSTPGD